MQETDVPRRFDAAVGFPRSLRGCSKAVRMFRSQTQIIIETVAGFFFRNGLFCLAYSVCQNPFSRFSASISLFLSVFPQVGHRVSEAKGSSSS